MSGEDWFWQTEVPGGVFGENGSVSDLTHYFFFDVHPTIYPICFDSPLFSISLLFFFSILRWSTGQICSEYLLFNLLFSFSLSGLDIELQPGWCDFLVFSFSLSSQSAFIIIPHKRLELKQALPQKGLFYFSVCLSVFLNRYHFTSAWL